MNYQWQLQDAKNRLSQVVADAADKGPQTITVRGKPRAVVLSVEEYRKLSKSGGSLLTFLMNSPLKEIELETERSPDIGRDIEL